MKTKIITLVLALCVLLCFAGFTVSADIGYTVSADIEYCTYSDGTVTFVLNFEKIFENCQMIASVHSAEGNLITATTAEIKANSPQIREFSMSCESLLKNSTLNVMFVKSLENIAPVSAPCSKTITGNTEILEIDLTDILTYTEPAPGNYDDENIWTPGTIGTVEYYESDYKTKIVKIDSNARIYYNGVDDALNIPSEYELLRMNGTMKLVLSNPENTNADYDTIYISTYEVFVVDQNKTPISILTNKIEEANLRRIDYSEDDDYVFAQLTSPNEVAMKWEELKENDVLLVKWAKTSSKNIYEAKVIKNTVVGTVSAISGVRGDANRSIKINNTTYPVAIGTEAENPIKLGDTGTYYLDNSNRVIYFTLSTEVIEPVTTNYSYVAGYKVPYADLEPSYQIFLLEDHKDLTQFNITEIVDLATDGSVLADGKSDKYGITSFGIYSISVEDIDLTKLKNQIITYELNELGEINKIETAKKVDTFDAEFLSAYANGTVNNMEKLNTIDNSFKVGDSTLYIDDNTVIFNVDTNNPYQTEIVNHNLLTHNKTLTDAIIYDVDANGVVGCIMLTTTNTFDEFIESSSLVVKVGLDTNDEGDEVVYVTGYKGLEDVTYISEDLDLTKEAANIGKLVVPEFNTNGIVKSLNVVSQGSIHDGKESYSVSECRGISGELTYINGRNIYLDGTLGVEDGREFRVKASANVYVYDATSKAKVKFTVGEAVGYFAYDAELGLYTSSDDTNNKVTVYAYEVDGNIVDLVYYIHE